MAIHFRLHRLFALLLLLLPVAVRAQDYYNDRIFVKLQPTSAIQWPDVNHAEDFPLLGHDELNALAGKYGITRVRHAFRLPDSRLKDIYEVRFTQTSQCRQFIQELNQLHFVEYAEAMPIYRMDLNPNDNSFILWALDKIDAQAAWDISTGSTEVVVAVVDNAVRLTHEDLAPNVWVNPNEIAGNNNDDDNNGYVDDINGYDAADDDNDPMPPPNAGFDHGSHVAGITSAATDNGTGIASIGWQVKLMCVKTKHDTTTGAELDNTFGGVDYAIAAGADVVNMSFGGLGYSTTYALLFSVGHDSGVVFVASAGNDNVFAQRFPAAYPYVISVGSTDLDDGKSSFSNYHVTVDVMAPGSTIWSCYGDADDSYGFMSGTSMSAPLTAGLCALILSVNDTLDPDEVEACLEAGCENIDGVNANYIGYIGAGRINARNSLQCAQNPTSTDSPAEHFYANPVWPQPATDEIHLEARFASAQQVTLTLFTPEGQPVASLFDGTASGLLRISHSVSGLPSGIYFAQWNSGNGSAVQRICVVH